MKQRNKIGASLLLVLLTALAFIPTASANSAEPPGLTVIATFPPDDLTLSIRFADGSVTDAVLLQREQKAWESYYRFFYGMTPERPSLEGAVLIAESDADRFECPLPESAFNRYNNLLTLDITAKSVEMGQPPLRQPLLVSMRVILTLLIEGLVFFAFRYRNKSSWTIFIAVNLLTQGALNVLFSGSALGSYWMFAFVFFELLIFIAETAAFAFLLKEYRKRRAVVCALTANLSSLILGGMLIAYLPV